MLAERNGWGLVLRCSVPRVLSVGAAGMGFVRAAVGVVVVDTDIYICAGLCFCYV